MNLLFQQTHPQLSLRSRYQVWRADLALRHGWFRILLHLLGMVRCPRNAAWHWHHMTHELYVRKPRP